ncbi:tRNA wybutosine-synthesizing protein 4 [Megalops cyprinoides]|uniref:tRNA wybutosine-synthesizing protein 4 n=1 Tax=Megalops cyprinoides TaxID=118141 RepID=UPI001863C6A0|nr:tRNA wybutosine-synthesizing protein 4 [Megalops cyprinoides]
MPVSDRSKKKHGKDTAVQGTNDSSVVSKVSAAAQGYFSDDFLKSFVCKVSRRAPLINRGYYVRWRAVDHCVKQFLRVTEGCARRQVLSLGAGFDSLYFRLHAEGALEAVVVFEVDFPDVAQRKAALINASTCLKQALSDWDPRSSQPNGPVNIVSGQYCLLGVDVRVEKDVEGALSRAGLQWSAPTLLLSEVVLTYMDTHRSDTVIGWAAKKFPESLFVMYEQVRPHDPFGRVMQDHFLKLNSALHALSHYPNTTAQRQRFLDRGWECCEILDMNQFYLGLVSEKERHRVESLEPFDEFEEWHQKCSHYFILTASKGPLTSQAKITPPPVSPVPCISPVLSPQTLCVRPLPGDAQGLCAEGLGMASSVLGPGVIMLSGGSGRVGRGGAVKVLIRDQAGWRCVCMEPNTGVRMYHTLTAVPQWGAVIFGGRSSPLSPVRSVLRVTYDPSSLPESYDTANHMSDGLSFKEMPCTGNAPLARWRHTTTLLRYRGQNFLFVFGGRTEAESVLGDAHFLCVEEQHWAAVPVEGDPPEARHSHSACGFDGGVVIFGGLGRDGVPLGDAIFLRPTATGFCWERLLVQPALVPRYSHSAHVIGQNLVLVGGVWLQAEGVPGIAVINLTTGGSVEYSLDTSCVPWPLMLHSFCSEPLDSAGTVIALIGGGGNCFSFGTHFNPQPVTVDLKPVL